MLATNNYLLKVKYNRHHVNAHNHLADCEEEEAGMNETLRVRHVASIRRNVSSVHRSSDW